MKRRKKEVSSPTKILNLQKERNHKLLGASIHTDIHEYLSLYALAKETSKSMILKNLVETWMEKQKAKESDSTLVKEVARRALNKWNVNKTRGIMMSLTELKQIVSVDLEREGLAAKHIERILNEIK
jgi:hypothetical protein